jgi:hypothetical protein
MQAYGLTANERVHERFDRALLFESERAAIRTEIEALPLEPRRKATEFVAGETDFEYWSSVAADNLELWGVV